MKNFLKTNFLTTIGWILSLIWLVFVGNLLRTHEFPNDLNSIGDFVAGMASPLAFLWVVIGYYQSQEALKLQAKELSQSSDALLHQVEEMRKTTHLQEQQLIETQEQYKDLRLKEQIKIQPFFYVKFVRKVEETSEGQFQLYIWFEIHCIRGIARNLSISFLENGNYISEEVSYIREEEREKIIVKVDAKDTDELDNKILDVHYFDISHLKVIQRHEFKYSDVAFGNKVVFTKFILE